MTDDEQQLLASICREWLAMSELDDRSQHDIDREQLARRIILAAEEQGDGSTP